MSNEFYNYIANLITDYTEKQGSPGDRFYIQLDSQEEVNLLVEALSKHSKAEPFSYQHEQGEPYETFKIHFNSHKLIVANTSSKVKPDFLVTLRNLVGEQIDEFNNASLLSIVTEQLDSIEGGSSNLQIEGMPLHPNSIFNNLEIEIDESDLSIVDKVILKNNLDYLLSGEPFQQVTFFDFKSIFSTLNKGYIEEGEFFEFGLFKDSDIASYPKKEQQKRLERNREYFEYVKRIHDYGFSKEQLEEKFSESGAKELIREDWYNISYSLVDKYHKDYVKENKAVKIVLDEIRVQQELIFWDRPLNEKAAGRRKRHIVIFNPQQLNEIELLISFSFTGNVTSLEKKFLRVGNQSTKHLKTDVKRKNIIVKINTLNKDSVFVDFGYRHNNRTTLGADFFIAILPIDPEYIDRYKTRYTVNTKQHALDIKYDDENIILGSGFNDRIEELNDFQQEVEMTEIDTLKLTPVPEAFNDDDELLFFVKIQKTRIPFLLTNELPDSTPISGQRIRKLIRENQKNMEWQRENNRLIMENQEFYFHSDYATFFEWEDLFVKRGIKHASFEADQLYEEDINLSDDLKEAYSRFITFFQGKYTIPSLCTVTEDLKGRAIEYLEQYIKEVQSFENGIPAGNKGIDLFKLGTIRSRNRIYLTPFHPLMIAYKIKYFEILGREAIGSSIINRLSPEALIPFIYDEKQELYKPKYQSSVSEWLVFKPVNQVSVSDSSQYLSKIVRDKIVQFQTHFSYLFMEKSEAPFKINIVNISNDIEIIRGILIWMIDSLNHKNNTLKPVEITLCKNGDLESSLDKFARIETVSEFKEYFDIRLKVKELEEDDVLRLIREKVSFYKNEIGMPYSYAHITFYKMEERQKFAIQPMDKMISGLAIDGLYSSVPSMKDEDIYRSGFGIRSYNITNDNILTQVAYYINELAANLRNSGNDSYRRGEAIFSRTTNTDEKVLKDVFDSSHWVTFVNPSVDLEFFNKFDENLVVIHYSDQYSSSSSYDAITVTNKSNQYFAVIKEFLEHKNISGNNENVRNAVKGFNMFNGEWLLRIIGSKGHTAKEKLSIISAIKYAVSYLHHPNILWVPISLEEILRIAGAVNLSKSDGVFTAKNLGVKGAHSDDLLLIGLELNEKEVLLHYYPVEVKIGINANPVLDKARTQVTKTKKLLLDSLTGKMGATFEGKFYRHFFVQIFLANARMLDHNEFWVDKNYHINDEVIEKLLKDDYSISNKLVPFIGEGAILSFQKDAFHRSAVVENGVLLLNLIEYDGYNGLIQPIEEMRNWIQEETNDLIKEEMLSYNYKPEYNIVNSEIVEDKVFQINKQNNNTVKPVVQNQNMETNIPKSMVEEKRNSKETSTCSVDESYQQTAASDSSTDAMKETLGETRLLLGTAENSNHKIYWEYGNKGLGNRHLLISGKSGQGKTYFMQCLLLEASKQGIPNIVVDYTEGFLPNQLETEFSEYLGDKIIQKIVYNEKFPINPFAKNSRDIGGIQLLETETDVAERIKSVFAAVYDKLGIQQLNAIYDATIRGLERYGDQMDLQKLKELLEEDNSSYAKTGLSQIRTLIDRNPFDIHNTIDWKDIIESDGEIFIIQLTGFNRDVQLMITEFILWDLWNYSVRYGNKNAPIPVIMDEAQNLDHRENSPSARILTEGRKFGWSAWYATQFLKAQLDSDELARLQNSSQKIYFAPPEEEINYIASSLSKDPQERKEWERKLSSLKKGQCIVHGPVIKPNGELSTPTVNIVDITSLQKRI